MEIPYVIRRLSIFLAMLAILASMVPVLANSNSDGSTGVEGTISAGPVVGGPAKQGKASTAPLANVSFLVKKGDQVVDSFQVDEQGHFRVILSPGHYAVVRKDFTSAVGSYGPFEVDIVEGQMKKLHWQCDTGLR